MASKIEENVEKLNLEEKKKNVLKPVNDLTKKIDGDCFDEWKKLNGCSFTNGFLIESLRTNDHDFIQKHGKRAVKSISSYDVSKGKGFASIILKCTVHFVDSKSDVDCYSMVLKIPGLESMDEVFGDTSKFGNDIVLRVAKIHETEIKFYNTIAPYCSKGVPIPKVYKTLSWIPGEKQGMIHMEDLSSHAQTIDVMNSLNCRQIENIIPLLVNLHKSSFLNKSKIALENDMTSAIKMMHAFLPMVVASFKTFLEMTNNDDFFTNVFKKYEKFVFNSDFYIYAYFDSWKDLKMEPVVVHGDFWGGNIMWKTDKNGEPTNEVAAFIDWQLTNKGSAMADIARIVTLCTDGTVRRIIESTMFEKYLDLLTKEMKSADLDCPFTLEQIQDAYGYMFLVQGLTFTVVVTMLAPLSCSNLSAKIKQAKMDNIILRCRHIWEDIDELLSGKFKHVFEKYGQ